MPRPRSFDETDIRSKIIRMFRETGFDGTSLPDLENATGLTRKSLYNAFGDKRDMFVLALREFRVGALQVYTSALLDDGASLDAIGAVLRGLAESARTADGRAGCLVCNTSREAIRHDPAVKREIDTFYRQLEERFLAAVRHGQAIGEINARPANGLARLCVGAVVSISVLGKAGQPARVLNAIASETVAALK